MHIDIDPSNTKYHGYSFAGTYKPPFELFAPEQSDASVQHLDARMTANALTQMPMPMLVDSSYDIGLRQCHHQGRQQDTYDQSPCMTLLHDLVL